MSFFKVCLNHLVWQNKKYWQKHCDFWGQRWRVMAVWNLGIFRSQIKITPYTLTPTPFMFCRVFNHPEIALIKNQCLTYFTYVNLSRRMIQQLHLNHPILSDDAGACPATLTCPIQFAKACLIGARPTQIMPPACLMGPSEHVLCIYIYMYTYIIVYNIYIYI